MRDLSHVLCFDGIYELTIRDDYLVIRNNPFRIPAVISSLSSKAEDDKDDQCNDRNAAKCSAHSRRNDGAMFRCYSE
jgi:hypothetical protein